MKRITLKIGLTMALLVLVGGMYSQTLSPVNNTIRLTSLSPTAGGTSGTTANQDTSVLTIDAAGVVTVATDFNPTATLPASGSVTTTGTVTIPAARSKTFSIILSSALVINQTTGVDYGSITTPLGIHRASDGAIGTQGPVGTTTPTTGIDLGEGLTFGFDLTNLPSTVGLQITKVYLSTFNAAETCTIVNRQDTSSITTVIGTSGGTANKDITSLNIILTGGTSDSDAVSFFNTSAAAQSFRITSIEFKLVALSSTWNGTAWSNTTPGLTVDAIIEGNYSASARGSFSAKTLTVNSGSLVIEDTKAVRVANEIVNNAGNTGIVVESGGFLRQDNAASVNTGAITVKRNSNSLKRLDYTMWSSPVSGSRTLAAFSPFTSQSPNRFYTYNGGTNVYDRVDPLTTSFNAGNAGKGFLIRMPNENPLELGTSSAYYLGTAAITYNGEFIGTPNNGTITLSGLTASTFYSVGNPYPSTLSAALFLSGNTTGGTLYFWRKTNAVVNEAPGNGTAYATRTSVGGTASGSSAPNDLVPSAEIAVGQGFIVQTGATTSLTFTNTMRANPPTIGTPFLKTKAEATPDRVWLNLTNATGAFSQALIAYLDTATLGLDNGIDGEYINDSSLALTSNINNKEYTIQGRPTFDPSDVVALNFKTAIAGDYTIAIDHFDGLFATGQDIYLKDNNTGAETDLKAGGYNFTAAAGVDNARFSLKYQKTLKVIDSEFNENSVTVYAKNGTLYVNSGARAISNIKVFDVQGRLIAEQKNVKSNTASFSNLKANQALIVQVSGDDNKVVSKKIVN